MTAIINPKTGRPFGATSYSGAGRGFGGQLAEWAPAARTVDGNLLPSLELGNARSEDLVRNHGVAAGGVQLHVDHIVGHLFRLSYKPRWRRLGISEDDARAFARDVEDAWAETAEDATGCWLDAERKRTFTMIIRESIATHTTLGEIMATAEWIERPGSNFRTAIKMISPHRVCNPHKQRDSNTLRSGIAVDRYGAATGYYVRSADMTGWSANGMGHSWRLVRRETSWGRPQFLHVFEPSGDGQSRGSNAFLSVMEQLRMLDKLQQTKIQEATVNAMYAAVIESELGNEAAMALIGGEIDADAEQGGLQSLMMMMSEYHKGADIRLNGAKIPHLVPGEKLNLLTSGNADNGFSDLEAAIIRYIASGLNVGYEQLARDYSKTNYSSARASMMETWRYMMGKRKVIAARFASMIFSLWLEEAVQRKIVTLPRKAKSGFYDSRPSWCNADWIGSGRLAIDGLKEVKEAVLRIEAGLSTYEKELALMGEDYQEVFAQQVREAAERKEAGLPPPSWLAMQALAPDNEPATAAA
ncbi:MAG: phage portal protein [Halioglobus sp.]